MRFTSAWCRRTLKRLMDELLSLPVHAWEERLDIKREIRDTQRILEWCLQYEAMRN